MTETSFTYSHLFINKKIMFSQENGTLQEFGLAPEGIEQAKLAGELFNKVQFFLLSLSITHKKYIIDT